MKTLIISVDYPLPEDKGNRMRTMHFVRYFKQHGDVDLICYKSHIPKTKYVSSFRKEYHIDINASNTNINTNIITRVYDKLLNMKPWIVNNYSNNVIEQIKDIIMQEDYDVVLCRYSVNAFPLLSLPEKYKKRVMLDIDDLMSGELYDAMNGEKSGVSRFKAAVDKMVFFRYQIRCLELGKILFCSEADRLRMARHGKADNMYVVPNIIPNQLIPETFNRDGSHNKHILFVGSLSYQPNEIGILWFLRDIFEKLPEGLQDMKLLVVGKEPTATLKEMCNCNPRVELIESPPDVLPYFEKCSVVIVPILAGGGTRIKILEAGNCFRPVISTRLGAYGLDLDEYKDILYFDDYDSFVEKLLWIKNKDNYETLTNNLKNIVDTKYTPSNFSACLDRVINEMVYQAK